MASKIYTNHTLAEYKKKYGNNKNLKKINKVEVISNKSLLNGRSWWLIDDTYYEIPNNKVKVWWSNLGKGGQIAICALLGAGVATAVVVPTVIVINNHKSSTNNAVIDGDDEVKNNITVSKGVAVDDGTQYTITSKASKNIDKDNFVVKMGGDTLSKAVNNTFTKGNKKEYKIVEENKNGQEFNIIISKETIEAHINVEITIHIKLVDPTPEVIKVTSVEITNTVTEVKVGEKIELTTKVLPENATNKELEWSMEGQGEGDAEFVEEGGKTYLKGKTAGQIGVTATAKDGSGKSDTKSFTVTENITTKQQFVDKANEWVTGEKGFCNSKLEYKPSQFTFKVNGDEKTLKNFYYQGKGEDRELIIVIMAGGVSTNITIASAGYSGDALYNDLKEETSSGVTYTITDDEIVYKDESAKEGKELHINKYGYPTYINYVGGDEIEYIYSGIPEIYYNIDWTGIIDDLGGSLYEVAKTATQIQFVKDENEGQICVGEGSGEDREPVYAAKDAEGTLKIWSTGKIRFTDDDKPDKNTGFFDSCSLVTSFGFSNIDTSYVTDFSYCFYDCDSVTNLDLKKFDTSMATYMYAMFLFDHEKSKLNSIDVSSFDTSNVTNMEYMFQKCSNLTSLDISSFDTSNVTEMHCMFEGCSKLTSLDISSFDTSNVTNMSAMFYGCNALTTIYVSDKFITDSVGYSDSMFYGCNELVGGKGSTLENVKTLDSEHYLDATHAKIDGGSGSKDTAGYFTDAKEIPTSDSWFNFTKIDGDTAYSVKLADSGGGEIPTNFVIPSTHKGDDGIELPVTKIDSDAFKYIETPVSLLVIPSSITEIGSNSFDNTFIGTDTEIRFKDTTHTWTIKDNQEEPQIIKDAFNPSEASKNEILLYLTREFTWSKNVTAKEKFLEKFKQFKSNFENDESELTVNQIEIHGWGDDVFLEPSKPTNISYVKTPSRNASITYDGKTTQIGCTCFTYEQLKQKLQEEDALYDIRDTYIEYTSADGDFNLRINSQGYIEKYQGEEKIIDVSSFCLDYTFNK